MDCDNENTPIPNETNQSFTATMNGNYAVEITMSGCATTSDCISINTVGISDFVQDANIQIYPNPTIGWVNISVSQDFVGQTIRITNIVGQVVEQFVMEQTETSVDLSRYESGVYFFKTTLDDAVVIVKVVKQ